MIKSGDKAAVTCIPDILFLQNCRLSVILQ